jgi:haloacetate dehalogenase
VNRPDDLFAGFSTHWLDLPAGRFFARSGGNGPPLLLLHGFPQTHVMWHKIAPILAQHFTVVMMDIRGYGRSAVVASDNGAGYHKRAMAQDALALMQALGFQRFHIAGHDRGGRIAYRLALDHPQKLYKCATLDIVPTAEVWAGMNHARAMRMYHWLFLAQAAPLPEHLIGANPDAFLMHTLADWTRDKNLSCFDHRALDDYRHNIKNPARLQAMCEDYRAGASVDRLDDEKDHAEERKIALPLLTLWGAAGLPAHGERPDHIWARWAQDVSAQSLDSGHFMAEENPHATAAALIAFFKS